MQVEGGVWNRIDRPIDEVGTEESTSWFLWFLVAAFGPISFLYEFRVAMRSIMRRWRLKTLAVRTNLDSCKNLDN